MVTPRAEAIQAAFSAEVRVWALWQDPTRCPHGGPRLRETPGARIVLTASDAHRFAGPLDFDDLEAKEGYRGMRVYGRSKAANILYTRELARRIQGSGVTVNCFHPGMVRSDLGGRGLLARTTQALIWPFARTAEQGADTGVWLATAPAASPTSRSPGRPTMRRRAACGTRACG